jgi:hypothetical protein
MTSKYPDHTHIFTDGLVIQGSTGCSFDFDSRPFIFHLHPFCSIFTAEIYALYRALLHLRHQSPGRFLLCTDSLSSLHALSSRVSDNPLVVQSLCITSELLHHSHTIVFCWIPGHTAIPGNEVEDSAARIGALNIPQYAAVRLRLAFVPPFCAPSIARGKGNGRSFVNNKLRVRA